MTCFDDLDDALLESVLQWLNSTELRNSACLVCKRWRASCQNGSARRGLWRVLDINVMWEAYHPCGFLQHPPVIPWRDSASGGVSRGARGRAAPFSSADRRGGFLRSGRAQSPRPAFLSKAALSRWLPPRAHLVEALHISYTESRATVVGHSGFGASPRHDLQPADLAALLGSLPALSELRLISASDLLPDPAALLLQDNQQCQPPPQPSQPQVDPQLQQQQHQQQQQQQQQQQRQQQHPANSSAAVAGAAPQGASRGGSSWRLPQPPQLLAQPLADRLRRLALCHSGYEFRSEEGLAAAAALGGLRALEELKISLDPPTEEGLSRLPESWSALTGLTALRLGGHQHLRRLPRWLPASLPRLRELELRSCGLRAMPVSALAGLPNLRLLSLERCPLGHGASAVSLDDWWPPESEVGAGAGPGLEPEREAAAAGGGQEEPGGGGGHGGGGAAAAGGTGSGGGGGGGIRGLEVLQLRDCDIVALPYAISQLTQLRRLELGGNPLGRLALPEGTGGAACGRMRTSVLRYLQESEDRGFELLAACPRLGHLGLESCWLAEVPPRLSVLTQLTSLDLSQNTELDLTEHQLADLMASLPQLAHLSLAGTRGAQRLRDT